MRCSAINPADPGVLKNRPLSKHDMNSSFSQISGDMTPVTSSPLSALQSGRDSDRKPSHAEQMRVGWSKTPGFCSFTGLCMISCGWLVKDDVCYNESKYEQPVPEEDILFCTLCNAEVRKYSKHCRSCDKCVDGFDHHCRVRTHVPPWGVSDDAPNALRPTRERNMFLREPKRSAVFWNRPGLGRFGGDPSVIMRPQSRILFGGSGISTSTFPSQFVRTWPKNPLAAHPDVSESELGTSVSSSPTARAASPPVELPSQASAPESFSIFFGPPIVPVVAGKREALQPPPPSEPATEGTEPRGVHIQIAAQSRPFVVPAATLPRSVTPRSESPTFVPRK